MAAGNGSLPNSVAFPQPLLDHLRAWVGAGGAPAEPTLRSLW